MKLQGKVAIVTGAGSGIGEAIAKLFAREGAKVVASDIVKERVERVAGEINAEGGAALAVAADVSKAEDVAALVDAAVKEYGAVDILVNNAGIMDNFMPAHEVTDALWEKVFAVNVTGPMRLIRQVLPGMMEKGAGSIINVASVAGVGGARGGAAYTASKHAMVGLTKSVGFMYAHKGIRCNAIAPGGVETNIAETIQNPSAFGYGRHQLGHATIPRMGKPMEIAHVALLLASDEGAFVNGAVIVADGGWTAY